MVINDDADATGELQVTLRFSTAYGANGKTDIAQMKLANHPDPRAEPWRTFAPSTAWTIEPDPRTGRAAVYALFRDEAGNVSHAVAADSIRYDPSIPRP